MGETAFDAWRIAVVRWSYRNFTPSVGDCKKRLEDCEQLHISTEFKSANATRYSPIWSGIAAFRATPFGVACVPDRIIDSTLAICSLKCHLLGWRRLDAVFRTPYEYSRQLRAVRKFAGNAMSCSRVLDRLAIRKAKVDVLLTDFAVPNLRIRSFYQLVPQPRALQPKCCRTVANRKLTLQRDLPPSCMLI
jgi:hypothetical protein